MARPLTFIKLSAPGLPEQVFGFARKEFKVGRASDNDFVLAHGSVAERHLRVVRLPNGHIVADLATPQGTLVDGQRITRAVIVQPANVVTVGAYTLVFQEVPTPHPAEQKFLAALAARPDDDDTRLVYCDWLNEQGLHAEAEVVGAHFAYEKLTDGTPKFLALDNRIRILAHDMPLEWLRVVLPEHSYGDDLAPRAG